MFYFQDQYRIFFGDIEPSSNTLAMTKNELLAALDADKESHISFLQAFIQAPSPNPPGDTTEAAEVIRKYLLSRGIESNIIAPQPQMPNIVSDFEGTQGSGPRVVMNGHIDVFPVGDTSDWIHGPWSGFNDGKHIYGRGGVDMKAGTAASVIAFSYLHKFRRHLKGSLALTVVSDEETGGRWGSRYLLEQVGPNSPWRGDVMINAEPGGLESIRFGEKGTLRITFKITTLGVHGAYTHLSEGANNIAMRFVAALRSVEQIEPVSLPPEMRKHLEQPEVQQTVDEIMGKGAAANILRPTLNIGTWHGGLKVNMIPDHCVVEADIRLPIGLTKEVVLEHINKILLDFPEVEMQVQEAASNPATYCAHDHPLVNAIASNAQVVTGRKPLPIASLGATDCKFWRYLGIPAYVYGISPVGMASKDEKVVIEEFLAVLKTHALAVWEYLSGAS